MADVNVYRVPEDIPILVGTLRTTVDYGISFVYAPPYLERPDATPLTLSLPCREEAFPQAEILPYFNGLLPEGEPRERTAAALGLALDDFVGLLVRLGHDCIGDVMFREESESLDDWRVNAYEDLDGTQLKDTLSSLSREVASNIESRLSLGGTQGKVGLAFLDGQWKRPLSGSASTHILKTSHLRDIPEIEFCCMRAAAAFGVHVPDTTLMDSARTVVVSARYDREIRAGFPRVRRLHQADLAQSFGIPSGMKYAELEGGTYRRIAETIRARCEDPAHDIDQLARIAVLNYLVGNCDNHLKNLSFMHRRGKTSLAPAYDIVSTTRYEHFSRDMGALFGTTRDIDEIDVADFTKFAGDLGISPRALRAICEEAGDVVPQALYDAGDAPEGIESTPYVAEDLVEELQGRLTVLGRFAA